MPQVQVAEIWLNILVRVGSQLGTGPGSVLPRVEAALMEVAYAARAGGVSEALLFAYDSSTDPVSGANPDEFVTTRGALNGVAGHTFSPPGDHVCDSTLNAYYIALTLTGPLSALPPFPVPPAVSAIWLTNV